MLVLVSNTSGFGKKYLVAPNASDQDDLLDISVFQDFSQEELHWYYAKRTAGGYSGPGTIQRYQARKLKVKSSPKLEVVAEGIKLGKGKVTIKIRPGALRVIALEKSSGVESKSKYEAIPTPALEAFETLPVPASRNAKQGIRK